MTVQVIYAIILLAVQVSTHIEYHGQLDEEEHFVACNPMTVHNSEPAKYTVTIASVSRPSPNSLYNEKFNCGGKKKKKRGGKKNFFASQLILNEFGESLETEVRSSYIPWYNIFSREGHICSKGHIA